MPNNLRIIILGIIYLIYLITCVIDCSKVTKKQNDKDKRKVAIQDYSFMFLCRNVILATTTCITFQEYNFLCYYKMILFSICVFVLILENLASIFSYKFKIQNLIFAIGVITVFSGFFFLGGRSVLLDRQYVEHEMNPSKIVNEINEEKEFLEVTVNLYELKCRGNEENSIGLNKEEGTYFFYYYDPKKDKIIEKEILPKEISSIKEIKNEKTYIIMEDASYDIIFTERRPESEFYKKEVSDRKYILYINPEEVVEVNE